MYADSFSEAHKAQKGDPMSRLAPAESLFDESVDLGVGSSPTDLTRQAEAELMAIVGPRLRKARRLAKYSESAAGLALAHKGVTQVSLFENGHRAPSLHNLTLLARFYGTTTDYLLGMHDDVAMAPEEGNQAVLCGVMAEAMSGHFHGMVNAMAKRSAIMLEGFSLDRQLLNKLAKQVTELCTAVEVVARKPEFEEVRGGAKLVRLIDELRGSMQEQIKATAYPSIGSHWKRGP
jgi:transcriptional regulator with XRE-family HTH domain